MMNYEFANPGFLYLLLALIPMIAWYIYRQSGAVASLRYSNIRQLQAAPKTWRNYLRHGLFVLRVLAFAALVIVLARPQDTESWQEKNAEGINIMLALDISSSMLAEDFTPNRLEASKNIAMQFISGRQTDKMGLVVFSGEAFTQCPLTTDHAVLMNYFKEVESGMIEDGTAIGVGLATAVNRLKDMDNPSKVIILLTDGENNKGQISPGDAADLADEFGIRVYTVGVGSRGTAPYPVQTPFGQQYRNIEVKIDEEVLRNIAGKTGGKYFRATNNQKLQAIYKEIDQMEKAKVETRTLSHKNELYIMYAWIALLAIGLELLLRYTVLRNIP